MRILLYENDHSFAKKVCPILKKEHYQIEWVTSENFNWECMREKKYDLYIIDWSISDERGFELCNQFRSAGDLTPIIIISERRNVNDKVKCLQSGADNYMEKPLAFEELLARINAIRRILIKDYK